MWGSRADHDQLSQDKSESVGQKTGQNNGF